MVRTDRLRQLVISSDIVVEQKELVLIKFPALAPDMAPQNFCPWSLTLLSYIPLKRKMKRLCYSVVEQRETT
jgi:hypothetical protein